MNKLQSQAFKINTNFLDFLIYHEDSLVKEGFLMPRVLSEIRLSSCFDLLRSHYFSNKQIGEVYKYSELLSIFSLNIQRANSEQFLFDIKDLRAKFERKKERESYPLTWLSETYFSYYDLDK
jgi:hypothetical protein